jgi:hypothetical protein
VDQHEIDMKQQQQIGKAFREIADIRGDVTRIETALIGIDGKNGIRGELREFMAQMGVRMSSQDGMLKIISDTIGKHDAFQDAVEARFENYMKFERLATCHGKSELNKYLESLEKENNEVRKSRIAMTAGIVVALISAAASIIAGVIK